MSAPIPGLRADGGWDIPARLNMAAQCLAHPADALAIIDTMTPTP